MKKGTPTDRSAGRPANRSTAVQTFRDARLRKSVPPVVATTKTEMTLTVAGGGAAAAISSSRGSNRGPPTTNRIDIVDAWPCQLKGLSGLA